MLAGRCRTATFKRAGAGRGVELGCGECGGATGVCAPRLLGRAASGTPGPWGAAGEGVSGSLRDPGLQGSETCTWG